MERRFREKYLLTFLGILDISLEKSVAKKNKKIIKKKNGMLSGDERTVNRRSGAIKVIVF